MCCPKQEPRPSVTPLLVLVAVIAAVVLWPTLVEVGRVAAMVVRLALITGLAAALAAAAVAVGVCVRRRRRASVVSVQPAQRIGCRQPSTVPLSAQLGQLQAGAVVIPIDAEAGLYLLASPELAAQLQGHRVEVPRTALPAASRRTAAVRR